MSNFQMSDVRFRYFRRLYLTTSFLAQKQNPKKKKKKTEHKHKFKKRQTTIMFHKQNYIFTNKDAGHQIKSKTPQKKKKIQKEQRKNRNWKWLDFNNSFL